MDLNRKLDSTNKAIFVDEDDEDKKNMMAEKEKLRGSPRGGDNNADRDDLERSPAKTVLKPHWKMVLGVGLVVREWVRRRPAPSPVAEPEGKTDGESTPVAPAAAPREPDSGSPEVP